MDTISRENNTILPIAGVIVGVLGLLLGGYGVVMASKVKNQLADDQPKIEKIDEAAAQAAAASSAASQVKSTLDGSIKNIQQAFDNVGGEIGNIKTRLATVEEGSKRGPGTRKGKGGPAEEVVAGPGEYIVKAKDTPTRIAHANGCTVRELMAVNPGVNWTRLHLGQKLKLPEKKPAA